MVTTHRIVDTVRCGKWRAGTRPLRFLIGLPKT